MKTEFTSLSIKSIYKTHHGVIFTDLSLAGGVGNVNSRQHRVVDQDNGKNSRTRDSSKIQGLQRGAGNLNGGGRVHAIEDPKINKSQGRVVADDNNTTKEVHHGKRHASEDGVRVDQKVDLRLVEEREITGFENGVTGHNQESRDGQQRRDAEGNKPRVFHQGHVAID